MKLAVKKTEDSHRPGNFHYSMMPIVLSDSDHEGIFLQRTFATMGCLIVEVDDEVGAEMMNEARRATIHELEVARLYERRVGELARL